MCKKQFLWVGLTCTILEIIFKRATDICKKQCFLVGLTCTVLDVSFKRAADVCKKQCLWAWERIKKKVNKNLLFFSLSYKHRVRYMSPEFGDKDPKPNFRIEKVYKIKSFN